MSVSVSVEKSSSPAPVTMAAAAEEQLEIPTEAGAEGEQMIPKKERKPHIKGITFREFDVSISAVTITVFNDKSEIIASVSSM